MARRRNITDDFDSPWKDALHHYLPAFLAFFFPHIHADIDWSRGYEALDKEFQQIVRSAKVGKLLADKLFKVWLKDGDERWLFVHIEIQGDYEKEFPERMFDYNSAVHKLYNQTVVSLAVLCDDQPDWRPTSFSYGHWGCKMELTFPVAKLLDYTHDLKALENNTNPFAAVVLAHRQALETRRDPENRQQEKLRLVKGLYRGNWSKKDVRQLFRLLDWIMTLPEELEEAFRVEVFQFEKEINMPWLSSIERKAHEKGMEEGMEKGLEEGMEKGLEEGMEKGLDKGLEKGLIEGIAFYLEGKFGKQGRKVLSRVRSMADVSDLRQFARFLMTAKTLDEVRKYFRQD